MLVIRVPCALASVHYRAYAERLDTGSVLDWILTRLRAAAPPGIVPVCVCDTESERLRLEAARGVSNREVRMLCAQGSSDVDR
jgi:hypothetical protein